ncbi:MAG TPA: hypothetical protein VLA42_02515 [Verrucomicrobiae bacterium]|jgi:hypothetical protein|nr:hypothetical protein [Verrucomicrobiae bacterium]
MKKAVGGAHNLIIFLCLAAALLFALAPTVAALVLKLLVPEWFVVALVVIAVVPTRKDTCIPQLGSSLSVFSPRPPPIQ